MTDQTVSEVLYGAADHMAAFGKFEGGCGIAPSGPTDTAAACAIGSIIIASGSHRAGGRRDISWAAQDALKSYLGGRCIPEWSDSNTAEEVVEGLIAAALIEAAKETDVRVVSPRVAVTA